MQHLRHTMTVTDPETGKVYPVPAGGSDVPPAPAPAPTPEPAPKPAPAPAPAPTPAPTPTPTPADAKPPWGSDEEFSPDKAWRLIQNLRGDVEELKPKAAKLQEYEDTDKTEAQKAADRAAAAEQRAADAEVKAARLTAAVKHGLTEEDLELLGTSGTPEEIEQRAEKLAARLATTASSAPSPPASRRQGGGGAAPKPTVAAGRDLYASRHNKST